MKEDLERESKWEVDRDFALPTLEELVPKGRVEKTSVQLTSTYYDTDELDLLADNVTLRRREGDDESGWQLKIPHARGRVELGAAVSEDLPSELGDVVRGVSLGKPLHAVTTIYTLRDRHRVLDASGELIAEVADDTVEATPSDGSADTFAWREVEIELGPRTERVPAALVDTLARAGARASEYPSKLSRVLPGRPGRPGGESTAERAIGDYLTTQIDLIIAGDIELRRGRDPIHDTRVACRRLRSTLRVFGDLLEDAAIGAVEDEVKWYAGLLGEVRDCQVQRRRLGGKVAALEPELVLGPVAARIESELLGRQVVRRDELAEAMDSRRYLDLLATLHAWKSNPPFADRVRGRDLVRRAHRAARKADKRLASAIDDQRDESLHRARKAAKRARYAAELHGPVRRAERAKANVAYYKKVQRVLGDHNDGVVSAEFLWRTATVASTAQDENGFTFGLLYANEKREADAAEQKITKIAAEHDR
ncbi:CYTH and CHAD domain-containing protein [Nocardia noduli]|uniref:CYTH and CHAD domain-containing protein n=1 Tax=Nocardia noduli TaxID=2815722 RepID=UPI001C22554F|nr:CYTH and CHAD domain-containing protein [Nocardia noduli]